MKALYGARLVRYELLWPIRSSAREVARWTRACDKRLHRLMCYIHLTPDHSLETFVGDRVELCHPVLSSDADYAGDIVTATWNGLYGPAGMAPELVQKIYADVKEVLGQGAVRERLIASGSDMVLNTPPQFQDYLKAEVARWGKVIKAADIRAE